MSDVLDLDWEFVDHLAVPESLLAIRQEQIAPDLIQQPKAREIFEFQLEHIKRFKTPAAKSVLEDEFASLEIKFLTPDTVIEDLIERLRIRYIRNQGSRALKNIAKLSVSDPLSMAHKMNEESRRLSDLVTKRGRSIGTGQHSLSLDAYYKRNFKASLGFVELDDHFFGLEALNFWVGAPKGYKSWGMVNCLLNNLMEGRFGVLFSLELPEVDTDWRLKCMAANVPFWKYHRRAFTDDDIKRTDEAAEYLDSLGMYKIIKPAAGERTVDHLINQARDLGADFIIIDQLQYVENSRKRSLGANNDTGEYWEAIQHLVDYSDDGPILVAHQYNRSVQGAEEMPSMQQIKGSSAIEEGATLVLGSWSNKEMRASNIFELGTMASRHYNHKNWEVKVKLTRECNFKIIGES